MPKVFRPTIQTHQRWQPPRAESDLASTVESVADYAPPTKTVEEIAAATIAHAQQEAERILADACQEAEVLRVQARDEGIADGRRAGMVECETQLAELQAQGREINQEREEFFIRIEADLVRLSLVIAEKVIAREVSLNRDVVLEITRTCLRRLREREEVRIRANPDDIPILAEHRQQLLSEVDGIREIVLDDDRRVTPGSVVLETESGSLDARLPSQLDVIRQALNDAVEAPRDAEDG